MRRSLTHLTRRPSEVLDLLTRGEQLILTYRGKDVACLARADQKARPERRSIRDYPAFGMWADREDMQDPDAWLREQRRSRF